MNNVAFPELGLEFTLNRTAFSIGSLHVQWYGIIIAVGFALAVLYCLKRAPKFGILQDNLIDMTLIATPAAIVGARLYYVVFNWSQFADDPVSIFKIWEGGIAIYGALIFGALAAFIYCRVKKINVLNVFDLVILGFMIGQIIGRWGNFVNAEAYGETVENWFLGMSINGGLTVHPIFLYESLWNLVGFVLLHFLSKKRRFYGQTFLSYLVWYGVGRGFIEGIRGGDALMLFDTGLRVSQLLGYLSALAAFGILVYKFIFTDRGDTIELLSDEAVMEMNAVEKAKKIVSSTPDNLKEETPADEDETDNGAAKQEAAPEDSADAGDGESAADGDADTAEQDDMEQEEK